MNTLASLLPGFREARAPLISGYLWLLAAWLTFGPSLPNRNTNSTYAQLWVVIDAIGPFGVALTLSIVAYLVGSLVQSATRFVAVHYLGEWWHDGRYTAGRGGFRDYAEGGVLSNTVHRSEVDPDTGEWIPASELLEVLTRDLTAYYHPKNNKRWAQAFDDVVRREFGDAWGQLGAVTHKANVAAGPHAKVLYLAEKGRDARVLIPQPEARLKIFSIPHAFLGGLSQIQGRLLDLAKGTGLRVEQFTAEAELREAVAIALTALVIVLCVRVGPGWVVALAIPAMLLVQARSLWRHASWELVDALRARAGTKKLEEITPLFARCRAQIEELTSAIESADWNSLPLDEVGDAEALASPGSIRSPATEPRARPESPSAA